MKVSVVIPVFNKEKYIERAVKSALSQQEVCEVVLVEDGSSDNSFTICKRLADSDGKVVLLRHSGNKNKGVAASRNAGIKKASSQYIAFLDADDYYLPNRFETTARCFSADNSIHGVYESIAFYNNTGIVEPFSIINPVTPETLFENLNPIGNGVWFSADGLTVKKAIFNKSGFFDETLRTSEDTFLWFKMASTAKLVAGNIGNPIAITERVTGSLSSDKQLADKDLAKMLLKLFRWCTQKNMDFSRKETILNTLFYNVFNFPFKNKRQKISTLSRLIVGVFFVSPAYAIFKSKAFRRYTGQFVGYNKASEIFKALINTAKT